MSFSSPKKILVVDDDPVVKKTVQIVLRDHGYEVLLADDGPEAVSIARSQQPDLILLDLSYPPDPMSGPLSDGFEIVEWLRRMPESHTIPVVIISGTDPEKYRDRFFEGEIAAYLQKPLDKKTVLAAIQSALGARS